MSAQARYWILTIPQHEFTPYLPPGVQFIRGQLERGGDTGYLHWQIIVAFQAKKRLAGVKSIFGNQCHAEPTRSSAANDYVWKEETRVAGTQFELGHRSIRRCDSTDWEQMLVLAKRGELASIPGDIQLRYYGNLKRIAADNMQPIAVERKVEVYWGPTGVGKSRKVWELAGLDAFPKDPRSKFWDGYRNQPNVVIDEFRGDIDISHVLRWFDRYPVIVEVKGSSTILAVTGCRRQCWRNISMCAR